ncbi:MAG: type I restriction enzyme S subunit [Cyclobacteriaceae bacterium]|jgi:type I restriction enzyme S subunit
MEEKKKSPALRFAGFNEDWESTQFDEIVDVNSGRDYKHLSDGKIPVYGTGGYMLSVDEALSYDKDAIGIGRKGTIDKPYLLKAPFWTVDTLFYATVKAENDLLFVYSLFQNVNWKDKDESTGVPSLSKTTIINVPVYSPNLSEQQQIGSLFKNIDQLITQHQKKHDRLVTLKKSMLEKMFPAAGQTVPEIRFKGFEGEWGEMKLKEGCSVFSDGDWIEAKDQSNSGIRLLQTGNVGVNQFNDKANKAKWISEDTFEKLNCTQVLNGDILISRLPEPAGRACVVPELKIKAITAVDCTIVRTSESFNNKFLVQYLSRQSYFDEVNILLAGGTRQRISRSNLGNLSIPIPPLSEQIKIGEYFQNIDNLISNHKKQLEKLSNFKKSLSEKMFV